MNELDYRIPKIGAILWVRSELPMFPPIATHTVYVPMLVIGFNDFAKDRPICLTLSGKKQGLSYHDHYIKEEPCT